MRTSLTLNIVFLLGTLISILLMFQLERHGFFKESTNPDAIDSFMTEVTYTSYDTNGQIKSLLKASHIDHQSKNDTLKILRPFFKIYTEKRIPWEITSEYGTSYHNDQIIKFDDNVFLHQYPAPNNPETKITTSELTIYPRRSYAETQQWVKVTQPGTTLTGKGIEANLKSGNINVLSNPRGTYVPPPQSH